VPEGVFAGVPTCWRVFGQGQVQVLALHCSLAHQGAWAGLAQELAGVALTAPDLLGHGRSGDWDGRADFHGLATRQAMGLLAQMPDGPVHLAGHSFGATVALRMALEDVGRIASLTLFEPVLFCAARAAGGPGFAAHVAQHAPFAAALAAGDRAQAAEAFQAIWGRGQRFADIPEGQRSYIIDRIALISAQNPALLEDAASLLAHGRLEGLGVPVLLAEGSQSPAIIGAINAELSRRLPQVRRVMVAGAGHMLPITHPAEAAALVRSMLD
jgi:lipase